MSDRIEKRDDVDPKEGTREYGHVQFADPTNHKYPIDTPETSAPHGVISITKITPRNTTRTMSRRWSASKAPPSIMA